MKTVLAAVIIVALLSSAAMLQSGYDGRTHYFSARRVTVNIPKASTLKIISLGFHDAVAELIFLWSIQFYSTTYYTNRWDSLEAVFETITDLSPDNPDFYLTGSIIMAREASQVEAALRLLEKGAAHFQNDYTYEYWAGYFSAIMLKDYSRAARYHEQAAKRPNALDGVMHTSAHYLYLAKDLDRAWEVFSEIKRTTPHDSIRRSADRHLYDIQFSRDEVTFTSITERFRQRYNRLPASLEEMVKLKFLNAAPTDYMGNPYGYDPNDGSLLPNQKSGWKTRS